MDAKDLVIDKSGNAHAIEHIHEVLPGVGVSVLLHALIVKSVNLSNATALVVTAEENNAVGIASLEGKEQLHSLNTEIATVDVVSHENVFSVRNITSKTEELHHIVVLTVNITTHANGGGDRLVVMRKVTETYDHIRLLHKDLLGNSAQQLQLSLLQRGLLSQLRNPSIKISVHFSYLERLTQQSRRVQ